MGVPGVSFQMGVRGLICVNLGVLDMKKFENHCSRLTENKAELIGSVLAFFSLHQISSPTMAIRACTSAIFG